MRLDDALLRGTVMRAPAAVAAAILFGVVAALAQPYVISPQNNGAPPTLESQGCGNLCRQNIPSTAAPAYAPSTSTPQPVANTGSGAQSGWGNMFVSTADATIATTTPTSTFGTGIGSRTFAANTLTVGRSFIVAFNGVYSTPAVNSATVTINVVMGAVSLATVTTGALPTSATNLPYDGFLRCTVRSVGVSGSIICQGTFDYATALTGVVKTSNALIGSATINTTVAQTLDSLANWSAVTTQTSTVRLGYVDLRN